MYLNSTWESAPGQKDCNFTLVDGINLNDVRANAKGSPPVQATSAAALPPPAQATSAAALPTHILGFTIDSPDLLAIKIGREK